MSDAQLAIVDTYTREETICERRHVADVCQWVNGGWIHPEDHQWYRTLKQLLLSGFCLLLTTVVSAQEFKVTERSKFRVTERVSEVATVKQSRFYVVEFGATWCGPCVAANREGGMIDKIKKSGFLVRQIDIDEEPKWLKPTGKFKAIERLPTFWLIERDNPTVCVKEWRSSLTPQQIQSAIEELDGKECDLDETVPAVKPEVVTVAKSSIYNGQPGSSHESRESLIDHLSYDGIHRGKHDRSQLEAMSDESLNATHNRDHGWNNSR